MKTVQISVRTLVEFILREGDIDSRRAHDPATAMAEGGRLHRKIQQAQGSEYHAEVPLDYAYESDGITVIIDGRADGIIDEQTSPVIKPVTIDEIKGTYRHLDKLDKPENVHLAQAKCYAYFYSESHDRIDMGVRMTYINMDTEEVKFFDYTFTHKQLKEWFEELIEAYMRFVRMELKWNDVRDKSIKTLDFPYEYRQGQKELVTHVYHTIVHNKKLFIEAPTGVGKTIATVFPAIKAIGKQKARRLFYLTAKTITRTVANNTIKLLRDNGLLIKSIVLTAKDKICFMEERVCNPDACPYAKGHFDRINEALYAILTEATDYNRETIEQYAVKYMVCPFEFALDISLFADAVICDYNYLFDPHVYLKRFFAQGKQADSIFLIDEAHNLIDRGRNMYSASLCKEDMLALKKSVHVYDATLAKRLSAANKAMLNLKRMTPDSGHATYTTFDDISECVRSLDRLYERLMLFLENHDPSPLYDEVLEYTFEISHFLMIYELMNDKYITYGYMDSEGDYYLRLFNVDPSDNLRECMKRGVSSILFSATLLPIQYYKSLLGGDADDYEVYAESSFDHNKRGLYLVDDVTTKYSERGIKQYERIASHIYKITGAKKGNYMVFFPSYGFMENVYNSYVNQYGEQDDILLKMQSSNMTEEEREEFLADFANSNDTRSLIGFCVLGGIFAEGIDLQGESLIGSVIVGTGIPMVCEENELIKEYFDNADGFGDGMRFAYTIPGFNKVLQAAGRVIRTHDDVGIVALLDYRFSYGTYKELYPREWSNMQRINASNITNALNLFWENK